MYAKLKLEVVGLIACRHNASWGMWFIEELKHPLKWHDKNATQSKWNVLFKENRERKFWKAPRKRWETWPPISMEGSKCKLSYHTCELLLWVLHFYAQETQGGVWWQADDKCVFRGNHLSQNHRHDRKLPRASGVLTEKWCLLPRAKV